MPFPRPRNPVLRAPAAALALLLLAGCAAGVSNISIDGTTDTALVALPDLGTRTYKGFMGGLYPNGSNAVPAAHAARGLAQARLIQPLDAQGRPSASGKYVLLSIGHSNTTQTFCTSVGGTACVPWSFSGQAAADPAVNHTTLAIVNGALGSQTAFNWIEPTDANYDRIRDQVLASAGLREAQVQIVWLKTTRGYPTTSLPDPAADAYILTQMIGTIARTLKTRYPNLRQVFISSRSYGGFATIALSPEPFAFENGFSVKWVIEAQIRQLDGGPINAVAGDLGLGRAPWLGWGAYTWAGDQQHPRGDGFFWVRADYEADGIHPTQSGVQKAGRLLLDFFKTSPMTRCWFVAGQSC
jgi:hypothetical protein